MGSIARVVMVALVFQTVTYFSLWFYARARRREKLEAEYAKRNPGEPLRSYVAKGMEGYDAALKRRLIWGVYMVPTALLVLLVYLTSSD